MTARAIFASLLSIALVPAPAADAQTVTYRGFVEARGTAFPREARNDSRNLLAELLARAEVFARPLPWMGLAAGLDGRADNDRQAAGSWRPDIDDRGAQRPRLSVRRLSATLNRGPLTLDVGKQFVRWGKADILNPTDRFAPRDYLNVIESEIFGLRAVRAVVERGPHTVDAVWVPFFTPSRLPLLDRRWTVAPPGVVLRPRPDADRLPAGSQFGARWALTRAGYELSVSVYDGFSHLPAIDQAPAGVRPDRPVPADAPIVVGIARRYPDLRMYGGDAAVPTRWFTAKGEIGYFTTSTPDADEYVLYVLQLERQSGEWIFIGGYAGEVVTFSGSAATFAPDRGIARTILGRASYTIDVNRSAALEGALRQDGRGLYLKGELSRAHARRWRTTIAGVLLAGEEDDFLGQYRRNSHVAVTLRYSY